MATNKNEAKVITEHISFDWKCKFNSTIFNSNQKPNNKTCQCKCNNYCNCKKDYSWNRLCVCENSKYLKIIVDTSVPKYLWNYNSYGHRINRKDKYCHNKKVRDCYNLHTVFVIDHSTIKLFITFYYLLLLFKTKRYNIKWKKMNVKSSIT